MIIIFIIIITFLLKIYKENTRKSSNYVYWIPVTR